MTANILKIVCGLVCVFVAVVNAAPSTKLPKGFIQCKKSNPGFDDCLKDAAQKAIPHLAKGVPSLGINRIDPLRISTLEIDQGQGPVSIKLSFKDLDISNIGAVIIDKAHFDPMNYLLSLELQNPKPVILSGDYEITGKVLILPIVGKGKCKVTLELSKIAGDVQMKPVVKNGITYLKIVNIKWKFVTKKMYLKFENLFNGDKALGDNMNVFLNENWREVLGELQPAIEDVFSVVFTELGQQFLDRVPYDQIYLE